MEIFENIIKRYIEVASKAPILGLVFGNLNSTYLYKYLKYTIIGGVFAAVISAITKAPIPTFFILFVSCFLIFISISSIYSVRFRQLVLNQKNTFENTVYILYFFIYTGVAGLLLSGYLLFGWFQKII